MLEVLTKHLEGANNAGCVVAQWISLLGKDEQKLMQQIKETSLTIRVAQLYKDLSAENDLPFKLTAFRSHLRGYCTCR